MSTGVLFYRRPLSIPYFFILYRNTRSLTPQRLPGPGLYPIETLQRGKDHFTLHPLRGDRSDLPPWGHLMKPDLRREVPGAVSPNSWQGLPCAGQRAPAPGHFPGKGYLTIMATASGSNRRGMPAVTFDKKVDQRRNVFPSRPKGRNIDFKNIQPVKQVLPKPAALHKVP